MRHAVFRTLSEDIRRQLRLSWRATSEIAEASEIVDDHERLLDVAGRLQVLTHKLMVGQSRLIVVSTVRVTCQCAP